MGENAAGRDARWVEFEVLVCGKSDNCACYCGGERVEGEVTIRGRNLQIRLEEFHSTPPPFFLLLINEKMMPYL